MAQAEQKRTSKAAYWLIFLVSTAICFLFLFFKPEWFWVMLPFILTSLVYALGVI